LEGQTREGLGERGKEGLEKTKINTNEATMLLKTNNRESKTMLKRTQHEPQLSAEMRASRIEFELSTGLHALAETSSGKDGWNRTGPVGRIQGIAGKYENRGNEPKKCLKIKDITFFSAANYAPFARNLVQNRAS